MKISSTLENTDEDTDVCRMQAMWNIVKLWFTLLLTKGGTFGGVQKGISFAMLTQMVN